MAALRLIVGLGNPGEEYAQTRHNAGFALCELLARKLGVALRREARFHGLAGRTRDGLWLLMPQTYMNRSGQSVAALARFHRIEPAHLLVLHDELDLPAGTLRLKFGGGLGGHNGLKDIVSHLGTQDFWRLRIGIGHPGERSQVVDYVLKRPRMEEQRLIDEAIERSLEHWGLIEAGEYARAQQKLHSQPPQTGDSSPLTPHSSPNS
jgi:PTH1 family peptidyl-tRNA hydrolase